MLNGLAAATPAAGCSINPSNEMLPYLQAKKIITLPISRKILSQTANLLSNQKMYFYLGYSSKDAERAMLQVGHPQLT